MKKINTDHTTKLRIQRETNQCVILQYPNNLHDNPRRTFFRIVEVLGYALQFVR